MYCNLLLRGTIFIAKWVNFITERGKCGQVIYYSVGQLLLRGGADIIKKGNFIAKWIRYYKVGQLLQNSVV